MHVESFWVLVALAVAVVSVFVAPVWRWTRVGVTIVHELGHAISGLLVGRRFTGFVVNTDMSGHAITVGKPYGPGRIFSAWWGYPAPALLGAALVQIAFSRFTAVALLVGVVVLAVSLVFARSLGTLAAILVTGGALGAVWWWGADSLIAGVLLSIGVFLLLGAWRHLGTVMRNGRGKDDPQQLAELSIFPAWFWNFTYILALGACTWWAWTGLQPYMLYLVDF